MPALSDDGVKKSVDHGTQAIQGMSRAGVDHSGGHLSWFLCVFIVQRSLHKDVFMSLLRVLCYPTSAAHCTNPMPSRRFANDKLVLKISRWTTSSAKVDFGV